MKHFWTKNSIREYLDITAQEKINIINGERAMEMVWDALWCDFFYFHRFLYNLCHAFSILFINMKRL